MLTHPTLDQLRQLGLSGMARAFEELAASPRAAELDHAEWLGLLLDRELADRQDRRLRARLRYARLRHSAAVEDVDYRTSRGLDRALSQKLALCGWIDAKQNLIIEGPTGVGKSWLACALGHRACRDNPAHGQRHPGRHRSERPADFNRNGWPTSRRNHRPISSECAAYPRASVRPWF